MIGIIGAMEEEVAALKSEMADAKVTEFASMTFYKGTLCGKDAVVVRSGIGKVNAAICAQILVDKFGVDMLINTGIAGSLDARIDIGDMVISTDAVHHDMDATIFGDAIGQVPRMDTRTFPADPHLVELAVKANEKANPQIHTFTGRVASGDQFISSGEVKARIVENFQALCTEMEEPELRTRLTLTKFRMSSFEQFLTKLTTVQRWTIQSLKTGNCPQRGACKGIAPDDLKPENK